jgi:excisionase family DNA binding protein
MKRSMQNKFDDRNQMQLNFDKSCDEPRPVCEQATKLRRKPATLDLVKRDKTQLTEQRAHLPSKPLAVTIKDACAYLGVQRSTVYNLMDNNRLQWQKIGSRRLIMFESMERLLGI